MLQIITGKFASKVIRENVDILAIVLPELKDAEGFEEDTDKTVESEE